MVSIRSLFETHINVRDLERSMTFYEEVVGLELGTKDEERRIAFYWIGGWANSMLGVWEKPAAQIKSQHFAFEIALEEMTSAIEELKSKSVPTRNFFFEETDMPSAFGWVPAVSIFFGDPDGNLLEYLARLPGDPEPDLGIIPWDEWKRVHQESTDTGARR